MISIVMPSMNQAAFLPAAVESIFAQPVDDLELVVMDGGSTDGTQRLLARLASDHAGRIRWFSMPDDGPASAINRAVQTARGPLIGWLNSDDCYTPGAIARALAAFAKMPDAVMVYGQGEHVDRHGARLADYPTLPPDAPLAEWAGGCPICQPTAFFRRDVFLTVGGLDTSLRTAFDYEFWLRLMRAYPGRIGFVDAIQAQSRLHDATITSRQRGRVALEGLRVVRQHVGPPPPAWLRTHFEELCESHPFDSELALAARCEALVELGREWLSDDGARELEAVIAADGRLQLAQAGFYAGVTVDGWVRAECELRLRQTAAAVVSRIVVHGEHVLPMDGPLRIAVASPDGQRQEIEVTAPGPFSFEIPVDQQEVGTRLVYRVESSPTRRPCDFEPGSTDDRTLAFRLSRVTLPDA